jgi:uncharacterized protein (DUF433 family)
MFAMDTPRITTDPLRMHGLACIRDTRLTVAAVMGALAAVGTDGVLAEFPYLDRGDVAAALEFLAGSPEGQDLPSRSL